MRIAPARKLVRGFSFMTEDEKDLLNLAAGDSRAIRIGESVLYPPVMVGGKAFQFDPWQNGFLYALQKSGGDMEKACSFVKKPVEWAQKFVSTRKFREFRAAKLNTLAVTNGALFEEWRELGIAGMRGYREWWEGQCELCHGENVYTTVEMEGFRQDDMTLKPTCKVCFQSVAAEIHHEAFSPSREQVQFWSEIGARVSPKIERVQHEFTNETMIFQTEDGV